MKNIALASAALLAAAVATPAAASAPTGKARYAAACTVRGAPAGSRCGIVEVLEDRAKPAGRRIGLSFAVIPGDGRHQDAILFIPGGPGQSGSDVLAPMLADLAAMAGGRDIVFLDQRGTGTSNPLSCPEGFDLLSKGPASPAFRACRESLEAKSDLRRYRTIEAVADLEEVRAALGYQKLNLVAGSYGVRVATEYIRNHPQRVRSALLRAAYAPDFNVARDGFINSDAELGRVLDDCAADPACAAAYPRLEAQLAEVDAKLAAAPARISLPRPGGASEEVEVNRELFQQMMYAMLLSGPMRQAIPMIVDTAATKGFQPLAAVVGQVRDAIYGPLPIGMYLSVICSEDAPRLRPGDLKPGRTPLSANGDLLFEICAGWPSEAPPASFYAPLRADVPTLILSGEHDPATTVAAADRLLPMLANGRHLVFKGTAHGPLVPQCAAADVARFVAAASVEGIAPDCSALALPPFVIQKSAAPAKE